MRRCTSIARAGVRCTGPRSSECRAGAWRCALFGVTVRRRTSLPVSALSTHIHKMNKLNRREVLIGAAASAVAVAGPALPVAAAPTPSLPPKTILLWPTDTPEQRQMLIVRIVRGHIAEIEGLPEEDVTTRQIHSFTVYYGMTHDDVIAAVRGLKDQRQIAVEAWDECCESECIYCDQGTSQGAAANSRCPA